MQRLLCENGFVRQQTHRLDRLSVEAQRSSDTTSELSGSGVVFMNYIDQL